MTSTTNAAMLSQRISSFCDFGNSIIAAATAMTHTVKARRRSEALGSSDNTTVTRTQAPKSSNGRDSNVFRACQLSRIASASVRAARPANTT